MTSIGDYTFYGCTSLNNINIPDSVTSIGISAFDGCTSLNNVNISDSVASIRDYAFYGCTSLNNIYYDGTIEDWYKIEFAYKYSNPMYYASDIYFLDENGDIDHHGKKYSVLKDVEIPNTITEINPYAFYGCDSVKNVYYEGTIEDWCKIGFGNEYSNPMFYGTNIYFLDNNGDIEYNNKNYSVLKDVEIPTTITEINSYTFYNWSSLKSVKIPDSVKIIGKNVFYGCNSIESIAIPFYEINKEGNIKVPSLSELIVGSGANLKELIVTGGSKLPYEAFNVSSLETIVIPASIEDIGNNAFISCQSLNNIYYEGTIEDWCKIGFGNEYSNPMCYGTNIYFLDKNGDIEYNNKNYCVLKDIEIPNTITKINSFAFYNWSSLKSVKIPDSVKSIGEYVFVGCNSLESITLPCFEDIEDESSVTKLNQILSGSLSDLKELVITSGLDLGYEACYGGSFENLVLPASIKSIGADAFSYCFSLENIYYDGTIEDWCNIVFISPDSNPMIYGANIYFLDENGEIEYNNKKYSELKDVVIPNTITKINSYAFYNWDSLKSIKIPDSVKSIGVNAFFSLYSLESIAIPFYEINKEGYNRVPSLSELIVASGTNLKELIVTGGSRLPNGAFKGFSLETIVIPASIEAIGNDAFTSCQSLNNIYYEGTIEDWCKIGFGNEYSNPMCYGTNIYFLDKNGDIEYNNKNYSVLKDVEIPNTITEINSYAFYNWMSLKSVKIPDSIKNIGEKVFYGCNSLESIQIPFVGDKLGGNPTIATHFGYLFGAKKYEENGNYVPVTLKDVAFTKNQNLDIRWIKTNAFYNCSSITSINIPVDIGLYDGSIFTNCTSLRNVYYDGSIEDWCNIKFYNGGKDPIYYGTSNPMCYGANLYLKNKNGNIEFFGEKYTLLENLIIPDTISKIRPFAFYGCNSLESVVIPNTISTLTYGVFLDCRKLKKVTIPSSVTIIGGRAFENCISLTNIDIPSFVTKIYENAFSGCTSLTKAIIPSTVSYIAIGIFQDCTSLTSVTIPFVETNFGYLFGALSYAYHEIYVPTSLKEVIITERSEIGKDAFRSCSSLKTVKLLKGVYSIRERAFMDCSSLTSIMIPNSVTNIFSNAFKGCNSLTINCEAKSNQYSYGWDTSWNPDGRPVNWGINY